MQTYFVNKIKNKRVYLETEDKHHIVNVMRMRVGSQINVVYNNQKYLAEIINLDPLQVNTISFLNTNSELNKEISLFQASIKPSNFEWSVQKATELGIVNFYQLITKFVNDSQLIKTNRILKIIKEASEQSARTNLMNYYEQTSFSQLIKIASGFDLIIVAYENEQVNYFNDYLTNIKIATKIACVIGPQGGFAKEEIDELKQLTNTIFIKLTKTILRSETASLYLLANLINTCI